MGAGVEGAGCLDAAAAQLNQLVGFAAGLPEGAYTRASAGVMGSTIGQHVRHLLDHYQGPLAAAVAISRGGPAGVIDYDQRERRGLVETDRGAAVDALKSAGRMMTDVAASTLAGAVRVRVMVSGCGRYEEVWSTLGREFAFANHHALHHHAMIRLIADDFGLSTPEGFGKAPSTLHHERLTTGGSKR